MEFFSHENFLSLYFSLKIHKKISMEFGVGQKKKKTFHFLSKFEPIIASARGKKHFCGISKLSFEALLPLKRNETKNCSNIIAKALLEGA